MLYQLSYAPTEIGAAGKVSSLPLGLFKPALIHLSYSGVILEMRLGFEPR